MPTRQLPLEADRSCSRLCPAQGGRYCSCEVSAPPMVAIPSARLGMTLGKRRSGNQRCLSKTISPPTTVIAQVVVRISGSGIFMMSFESTVKSASFPASIDPLSRSSNAA